MSDAFERYQSGLSDPATHIDEITPSDTADLANACRSLLIEDEGPVTVKLTTTGGTTATITNVRGLSILPFRIARVWATGTTATLIKGLR